MDSYTIYCWVLNFDKKLIFKLWTTDLLIQCTHWLLGIKIVMKLMLVKCWCINVAILYMIQNCLLHSWVKFNLFKLCYLNEPVLVELEYVFILNLSFPRIWTYWLMQLMHIDLYALKNLLDFSSKCYLF